MTMRPIWVILLLLQLVSLTYLGRAYVLYRRAGLALPEGFVSGAIGSGGLLLLMISQALGPPGILHWATFAGSALLIGYSLVRFRRARVRAS
jgi:hypothetical protein